ncbi:MAG: PilZ domain-containing protein, partial [Candidatus Omnitrophica bacterium]|nr:PilZ domain-containing protein [Candidatus Omnitrophota bacterium]
IFVNERIEADTLLLITVYLLDGSTPIEVKGKVVWVRPSVFVMAKDRQHYDIGVDYVEISDDDRERLVYYTSKYSHEIPPSDRAV